MLSKCGSRFPIGALCLALGLMTIGGHPARAEIIHVPTDYPTIQEAIDAAAEEGDEIIVAPETYHEAIDFLGKAIWLHSSDGPEVTIIDGAGLDTSVVSCVSGETAATTLESFTITNGNAQDGGGMLNAYSSPTVIHCIFENNMAGGGDMESGGGGMFNDHSSPTVLDCLFIGNTAIAGNYECGGGGMLNNYGWPSVVDCAFVENTAVGGNYQCGGGGICNIWTHALIADCVFDANSAKDGGAILNANELEFAPVVTGCTFTNNHASSTGGGIYGYGQATVLDCTFTGNTAGHSGGAMHAYGGMLRPPGRDSAGDGRAAKRMAGGERIWFSQTVVGCTFMWNSAESGGGMCNFGGTHVAISNCTFARNSADDDGGGIYGYYDWSWIVNCAFSANMATRGGAIYQTEGDPSVANCLFTANIGLGAMWNEDVFHDVIITNCTFNRNSACALVNSYSDPTITNCIFWGDAGGEILNDPGEPIVTYCNVQGGYAGEGNIDADPLFADPDHGDYRIAPGSPCIDAADNTAVPADEIDLDEDGDIEEPIPFDLGGNPRFVDDPDTEDTGYGEPPIVDMGAYEYQGPGCPADFDGDGDVDTADLLFLLGCWGQPCGDVDGDGDTDTADLLALLGAWGACP